MKKKTSKKQKIKAKTGASISPVKKKIFWGITIVIPFLIFMMLELSLQIFNYGGDLDLFIDGPSGYEEYKQCNQNVARRYFSSEKNVPTPPIQLFRKTKNKNGLRYFVLGGSSAAGFPYGNNLSFPKILENKIKMSNPGKDVEVINVAMSAINSYSLLDLVDEVLDESPDGVLVYAGHNEFYGALGVGSVQSLGNWRGLIRTYLKLHNVKSFLLLKDLLSGLRTSISRLGSSNESVSGSSTLMARVVKEQTIPLGGDLYNQGKEQFIENMNLIIKKAKNANIPIMFSELVSNLRDHKPFVSIDDEKNKSANQFYLNAKLAERNQNYQLAKENYTKAKDLDALRFRSTEEFNSVLTDLCKENEIPIVSLVSYFKSNSENGIMGNNLFLEHLHPNKEGYKLIAESFFNSLKNHEFIKNMIEVSDTLDVSVYTKLDSIYGALVIKHLKGGWPFKSEKTVNRFFQEYKPKNKNEEVALKVMVTEDFNLEAGHMELGDYYQKTKQYGKATKEYLALISSIPHEISFYEKAARSYLAQKKFTEAAEVLLKSNEIKTSDFANKWIGQIALRQKKYDKSIKYLLVANHKDDQVLFNLSRSYYLKKNKKEGDKYFTQMAQNFPKSKYTSALNRLRKTLK